MEWFHEDNEFINEDYADLNGYYPEKRSSGKRNALDDGGGSGKRYGYSASQEYDDANETDWATRWMAFQNYMKAAERNASGEDDEWVDVVKVQKWRTVMNICSVPWLLMIAVCFGEEKDGWGAGS